MSRMPGGCGLWGPWVLGPEPPHCQRKGDHPGLHEWHGWLAGVQITLRWTRGSTTQPLVMDLAPEQRRPVEVAPW